MSRRTPIKELIDEDSVTGSPRRKSSRIASKTAEDKEIPQSASKITRSKRASLSQDTTEKHKDDDEVSVTSNASSTSSRRITRAASKSPTRLNSENNEGPARRTRRASSTSSLRESTKIDDGTYSPLPKRAARRASRSTSTSPSAEPERNLLTLGTPRKMRSLTTPPPADTGTSVLAKPKARRPSISDKVTPLESIEETDNKNDDTKEQDSESIANVDNCVDNDDNLPFKKKRKTLNLQTIEEKSFTEDVEDKTNKEVNKPENDLSNKPLPKFSLSLIKDRTEDEIQEEEELKAVLEKTAEAVVNKDISKQANTEVENNSTEVLEKSLKSNETVDSDSVFNSSVESESKQLESVPSSINTTTDKLSEPPVSSNVTSDESKTDEVVLEKEKEVETENSLIIRNEPHVNTNTSQDLQKVLEEPQENEQIIPASPPASPSPKRNESGIHNKSDRRSLSDSEEICKKGTPKDREVPSLIITSNLNKSSVVNVEGGTTEPVKENGLNLSGSSDLSDKENQKQLNVDTSGDKRRTKSFSGDISLKTKDASFYEPMEVEYASDIDKTVYSVTPDASKLRSSRLSQKFVTDYLKGNSTPIKSQSPSAKQPTDGEKITELTSTENPDAEESIVIEIDNEDLSVKMTETSTTEVNKSSATKNNDSETNKTKLISETNTPPTEKSATNLNMSEDGTNKTNLMTNTSQTANAADATGADESQSLVQESDVDSDEVEENHPSIVRSSDEEAATAEKQVYSKTTPVFKSSGRSKHPIFSDETYNALVNLHDESDKSDDPDFEVTSQTKLSFSINSDSDKTFKELNAKIDDLIATHNDDESSSEESVTHFLDEFAEEGEEDTPSEGSNDIIDEGESIGSSDSVAESDESYEADSFIDDAEHIELLSGDEYDLGDEKSTPKKRSRIITLSDSDDNIMVNGEVEQDDELEKMSTRPYCGLSPPSIISIRESPSIEKENDEESVTSVVINKEDNLQSLEEIKQISPGRKSLEVQKSPAAVAKLEDAVTPNNSLTEGSSKPRKRLSSIKIQDNISIEDIEHGGIGERINKVIDAFYSNVKESSLNVSDNFSLNISLDCVKSPAKDENIAVELRLSSPDKTKKRKSSSVNPEKIAVVTCDIPVASTEKPKKSKKRSLSKEQPAQTVEKVDVPILPASKIPLLQKESKKKKGLESPIEAHLEKPTKCPKLKGNQQESNEALKKGFVVQEPLRVTDEKKLKKKKSEKRDEPNSEQVKSKSKKIATRMQLADNESDMSTDLDEDVQDQKLKVKPMKKRKLRQDDDEAHIEHVKKTKLDEDLIPQRKTRLRNKAKSFDSGWVIEKVDIDYFPSSILKVLETEVKPKAPNKTVSKPKFVPSTSDDRKSWGYTRSKNIFPSTSNQASSLNYAETISSKDFKNQMLFNPNRVKREDTKTYLKKKEKNRM